MNPVINNKKEISYELRFLPKTGNFSWTLTLGHIDEEDSLFKQPNFIQSINLDNNSRNIAQSTAYIISADKEAQEADVYLNSFYLNEVRENNYVKFNKLTGDGVTSVSGFGSSIAMTDNIAVIGAPNSNQNSGAVFLFKEYENDGIGSTGTGGWSQYHQISGDQTSGHFGSNIDIVRSEGFVNALAVSATGENEGSGAVYLYKENGTNFFDKITGQQNDEKLGRYLKFLTHENVRYLAVSKEISGKGAVDIFKESNQDLDDFNLYQTIQPQNSHSGDMFGYQIDHTENSMFISCPNEFNSGAVYHYEFDEELGNFQEKQRIIPSDLSSGDNFGKNISFSNEDGIISSNKNSGVVYIYDYDEEWEHISSITGTGSYSGSFGGSLSGDYSMSIVGKSMILGDYNEQNIQYLSTGIKVVQETPLITISGVSGKIFDQSGRFIYGYNDRNRNKIYGDVFSDQYNIYINNYLCVSKIDKPNLILNGYEISGFENFDRYQIILYNKAEESLINQGY